MILSKPDILRYLSEGTLKIEPLISQDRVAQVSIDLSLGRKFTVFKEPPGYLPAIHVDPSLWTSVDLWHHCEQETFRLNPLPDTELYGTGRQDSFQYQTDPIPHKRM